jgi:hypothetical protein
MAFAGTTLAAEEGTRDAPTGVHAFFVVYGERQKIDVRADIRVHGGGSEYHGVADAQGDCAAGLHGELTGLEGKLLAV